MLTTKQIVENKLSIEDKKRLNTVYCLLCKGTAERGIDKLTVAHALGLKNERSARDYVSGLKKLRPVICHHKYIGFRIALSEKDIPDNERTIFEILSRVYEMLNGIIHNFKFERKHNIEFAELEKGTLKFIEILEQPKVAQSILQNTIDEK